MVSSGKNGAVRQYTRTEVPRMRWTPDLHRSFLKAIKRLGGEDKATPKSILTEMGVSGVTISHVKSHLQMFRIMKNELSRNGRGDYMQEIAEGSGTKEFIWQNAAEPDHFKKSEPDEEQLKSTRKQNVEVNDNERLRSTLAMFGKEHDEKEETNGCSLSLSLGLHPEQESDGSSVNGRSSALSSSTANSKQCSGGPAVGLELSMSIFGS